MSVAGPDRFRKAALALHDLSLRDQAWLLRRLLPSARAPLQAMLRELRALGIVPGMAANENVLPVVAENTALDTAEVKLVDAASASRAGAVLARQPEQLQAVLLNLRPWRWRADYWAGLSSFQRSRLAELLASAPKPRAAMVDALLHAFKAALESGADADGAGAPR
jgi:AcrR family transcriptional regulator